MSKDQVLVAAYIRSNPDKQYKFDLEQQRYLIDEYCKSRKWRVAHYFVDETPDYDEAVFGFGTDEVNFRQGFTDILMSVDVDHRWDFGIIIATSWGRFFVDMAKCRKLLDWCTQRHVKIGRVPSQFAEQHDPRRRTKDIIERNFEQPLSPVVTATTSSQDAGRIGAENSELPKTVRLIKLASSNTSKSFLKYIEFEDSDKGIIALGYVRRSKEDKRHGNYDLSYQEGPIVSYCRREGWPLVAFYSDDGVSGGESVDRRPALRTMFENIEQGIHGKDVRIIYLRNDRLARSQEVLYGDVDFRIKQLAKQGVKVQRLSTELGSDNSLGSKMANYVADDLAEFEREITSQRTKFKFLQKYRNGEGQFLGRLPLGFTREDRGEGGNHKWVLVPSELAQKGIDILKNNKKLKVRFFIKQLGLDVTYPSPDYDQLRWLKKNCVRYLDGSLGRSEKYEQLMKQRD